MPSWASTMGGGVPIIENEECLAYATLMSGPWRFEALDVEALLVNDDGSELFDLVCSETVDAGRYYHAHSVYGAIRLGRLLLG